MHIRFKRTGTGRFLFFTALIVFILMLFRLSLPVLLKSYVNEKLDSIQGFDGSIEDVDITLWKGAYRIRDVTLDELHGDTQRAFFHADTAEFSIEWHSLFDTSVTGELFISSPEITFVKQPSGEIPRVFVSGEWRDSVRELFPLRIGRIRVENGTIRYIDDRTSPAVAVALESLNGVVGNISNSAGREDELYVLLKAEGLISAGGFFSLSIRTAPRVNYPSFLINASVTGVDLSAAAVFFSKYGNYSVNSGIFSAILTARADGGGTLSGSITPSFRDLDVSRFKNTTGRAARMLLESQASERKNISRIGWDGTKRLKGMYEKNLSGNTEDLWFVIGSLLVEPFEEVFLLDDRNGSYFDSFVISEAESRVQHR